MGGCGPFEILVLNQVGIGPALFGLQVQYGGALGLYFGYADGPYVGVICYGDHSQCREEVVEPPRWCFWGGLGWGVGTSARDQKGGCRDFRILEKTTSPFFF